MQLAISASPHMQELELQDFARQHDVNAAVLGRQADLDMWISKLRTAALPIPRYVGLGRYYSQGARTQPR